MVSITPFSAKISSNYFNSNSTSSSGAFNPILAISKE